MNLIINIVHAAKIAQRPPNTGGPWPEATKCESGDCVATIKGFEWIFENIIVSILGLAGIVFFLMITMGGFKYITSGGDPKAAAAARQTITHALMGLILVAAAYLILLFIQNFTGANLTDFKLVQ